MDEESAAHRSSLPQTKRDPPIASTSTSSTTTNINSNNDPPIWIQESSPTYKFRSMPLSIRKAIRIPARLWRFLKKWSKGPKEVRIQKIRPFFPDIQALPLRFVERYLVRRSHKILAGVLYWFSYAVIFTMLLARSAGSGHVRGYGLATPVSCGDSLW